MTTGSDTDFRRCRNVRLRALSSYYPVNPNAVNFDLIAPVYDALSRLVFGQSLQKAQLTFLPDVPPDSAVLLVGGGTGALLEAVLTQCRPATVLFLEASSAMLEKARWRVAHHPMAGRVTFRHGTEQELRAGETFAVVMLPFVLDVSPEQVLRDQFLPALLRATVPGGCWLVTDFVPSPHLYHRLLLGTMYGFFRLVSGLDARRLPDWPRLLVEAGLTARSRQAATGGQVQTGLWTTKGL